MNLKLTGYQVDAVERGVVALREAAERWDKHQKLSAVSLSAPTGAGKTVIAAAIFERMWLGDADAEPNPDLTILWVTDDPSLNEQTRRKIAAATDTIFPGQLVSVNENLNQPTFDTDRLYFVHIQQLGKGAKRHQKREGKEFGLWETIANTVTARRSNFLLVIDEAHRGTSPKKSGNQTIAARLIAGAPDGQLPAAPVVLGISATPQRFNDAMNSAGRTLDPVAVTRQEVRESGLIKDKIRILHPKKTQPGDDTLLEMATKELHAYDQHWADYAKDNPDDPGVRPAMVVQVRPSVPRAELQTILSALEKTWNILTDKAIGHTFEEHTTLSVGAKSVRYIAPMDIQDDTLLRVVLCKEALTTGWDCPRAEVMMSYRHSEATDATYVAQLIGRMVRNPLARRIESMGILNTTGLFLPHFNDETVERVIKELEADEAGLPPLEKESVICYRNSKIPPEAWDLFADLPTYTRPSRYHRNEVSRLNGFATLLAGADIDEDAPNAARSYLVDVLDAEAKRLGKSMTDTEKDLAELEFAIEELDLRKGGSVTVTGTIVLNPRNIEDLFRRARRLIGDAAAKWYWEAVCDRGMDPDDAKIRVAALAQDPAVVNTVESSAETLIENWRNEHNSAINDLPDGKRAAFYRIWEQAKKPQQVSVILPGTITAPGAETRWKLHLYVDGRSTFPAKVTGWERDVLDAELKKKTLKAWYRNPTGGHRAISVPYETGGVTRSMHPDFVFVHDSEEGLVLDLVDPHQPNQADTGPKWLGLSRYAGKHADRYRRVVAVVKSNQDALLSVDLKNPAVSKALETASTEVAVRKIFDDFGGLY